MRRVRAIRQLSKTLKTLRLRSKKTRTNKMIWREISRKRDWRSMTLSLRREARKENLGAMKE